jgi:hypothetical protein
MWHSCFVPGWFAQSTLILQYDEEDFFMGTTRAQKCVRLCELYRQQCSQLKARHPQDEREERRILGCCEVLSWVISYLEEITEAMEPGRVHMSIEALLERMGEQKTDYLLHSIGPRRHHELNQLAEWMAEEAIVCIDTLVQDLWKLLSPPWHRTFQKHGTAFQVYHSISADFDPQVSIQRWQGAERGQWFREVAIVRAKGVNSLEEVFALTNHVDFSWHKNPQVLWSAIGRLRSTSVGDIIVSIASDFAWVVYHHGMQLMVKVPPAVSPRKRMGETQ